MPSQPRRSPLPDPHPPPTIGSSGFRGTDAQDRQLRSTRRWRPWIFAALSLAILLAFVLLAGRWQFQIDAGTPVARAGLRLATVEIGDVERELNVQGRVVAAASPTLYSPAQGVVSYRVQAGDSVNEGDLLAEVDSPALSSELQQEQVTLNRLEGDLGRAIITARQQALANKQAAELAKVDLDAAIRELGRADDSFARRVISEFDHQAAADALARARLRHRQAEDQAGLGIEVAVYERQALERDLERQRLRVVELQRRVDGLAIRSPVTGMIGSLALNQNSAVIAQQALLTVVDLTRFAVQVAVPESYADDIGLQLPVSIRIGASEHAGAVTAIAPEVIDNQVTVRLRFTGELPSNLRQNQRLGARILLEQRSGVLSVERGPFVDADQGRSVFRVDGEQALRVPVTIGAMGLDRVEIVSGLDAGDRIIISDTRNFQQLQRLLLTD